MPPAKRKPAVPTTPTPVDSLRHAEKRKNIPTGELHDFVADSERSPKTVSYERPLLYPRDAAADPQLVWRGKDEQDAGSLVVPSVPVYIQEKIEPKAIIENLRNTAEDGAGEPELSLFEDFDGLDFGELVDFYGHDANWSNRLVLGDSLLVMTSLAEKEGLASKVQTIFMDPPYGIKFGSNWQVSTRKREVTDSKEADLTRQPEQIRAFRDTWKLGIHSYLAYLRDRFQVALDLLNETGSIFVQIGDENVHLVRNLLDEVFGRENFVSLISYSKTGGATGDLLPGTNDYILWFAKDKEQVKYRRLYSTKEVGGDGAAKYDRVELADGTRRPLTAEERRGAPLPAGARVFRLDNITSQSMGREKGEGAASWFPVKIAGREYRPTMQSRWKTNEAGMERLLAANRVAASRDSLNYVRFLDDFPAFALTNSWADIGGVQSRSDPKVYVVQTSTTAVMRCLLMTTDPGDLVLDPTCGSGTTAFVAEQWGRRWITTDTSRVALTLARTRLMSSRFPYYVLADSDEGRAKEAELNAGFLPVGIPGNDIRQGFVTKRIPHVTLKAIAQNPEIKEGMARDEIARTIVRHSDFELLHDQPFEDKRRIRVAGPFTVESLAPHRVVDPDEDRPATEAAGGQQSNTSYEQTILEHLRKAGVQNTVKGERLQFERLESFAGAWLQAAGEYVTADEQTKRVAVTLGPQYGTVGPEQIKESAKEALRGEGFDMLLVCGFAFDARSNEVAAEFKPKSGDESAFAVGQSEIRMGKLPVLLVKMNPDLAMGETLLKNTGAGNLFMVFGEPDIDIRPAESNGHLEVEIHGVDVFDPTTGQVRSGTVDDIACWFIDTSYNSESFFVRQAYFTGSDEPYKRLAQALRTEIDEVAWERLYRTRSLPFAKPTTGRIAVKVINHYGDEVLKVYDLK